MWRTPNNRVAHQKQIAPVEMSRLNQKEAYGFFDRYYSRVRAFIRSIVKEDWIAEDLTQEVFIRAFQNLHTLKDKNHTKSWLFRIAKNLCTDYFRQKRNEVKKNISPIDSFLVACSSDQERVLEKQQIRIVE